MGQSWAYRGPALSGKEPPSLQAGPALPWHDAEFPKHTVRCRYFVSWISYHWGLQINRLNVFGGWFYIPILILPWVSFMYVFVCWRLEWSLWVEHRIYSLLLRIFLMGWGKIQHLAMFFSLPFSLLSFLLNFPSQGSKCSSIAQRVSSL